LWIPPAARAVPLRETLTGARNLFSARLLDGDLFFDSTGG
jgi:hypothetical protein